MQRSTGSENQDPQVDESVMEVEATDESTISEIVVSPVSNIIDICHNNDAVCYWWHRGAIR